MRRMSITRMPSGSKRNSSANAAGALFRKHADKEWSFTDCVSFATMRELRIRDAFTTDHHFKQAGFVALLKA
jgi:predicted nucleic acid-binding protein